MTSSTGRIARELLHSKGTVRARYQHAVAGMSAERETVESLIAKGVPIIASSEGVQLIKASALKPEPIHWLWSGWLARGKLHIIAGAPGCGKTTIGLSFAATITSAGRWPDGTQADAGNVLVWSGEDGTQDTLLPRLIVMGADVHRVFFVGDVSRRDGARPFDPALDMHELERRVADIGGASLVIIDPIVNCVAGDSHKNTETRRALQPVVDFAQHLKAAVVGISHYTKGTAGRDPVERVTGSVAFGALPRLIFGAAKSTDEEGTTKRIFVRAKSNIGPDGGGYEYELLQHELVGYAGIVTTNLMWTTQLDGTARALLAAAEVAEDCGERNALSEAKDYLKSELAFGRRLTKDIEKGARGAGISERTLNRARHELSVKSTRDGFTGTWFLTLPGASKGADPTSPQNLGTLGTLRADQGLAVGLNGHLPEGGQGGHGGEAGILGRQ